jgi:CSLREA domain-containing protein
MRRRAVLLLTTAMTAALVALMASGLASAQTETTFTVNSIADTGDATPDGTCDSCTLREAIQEANFNDNDPLADTIAFAIPGNGPHTIAPASRLDPITEAVTIDGYTQGDDTATTDDDAKENTLRAPGAIDAVLKIELDGTNAGPSAIGLDIEAPGSVIKVKGLVVNNWDGLGIVVLGAGTGTSIQGNYIGTDASGTVDEGNRFGGVELFSNVSGVTLSGVNVGGTSPDKRNLISGNGDATFFGRGVMISGAAVTGTNVEGNLIGTKKDGTGFLGNRGAGVEIGSADGNTVGGTDSDLTDTNSPANTIAHNLEDGVRLTFSGTGNRILSNSIHGNGDLGIDLSGGTENAFGVTANDRKDRDTGPNNLQNYPVLASATHSASTGTNTIKGRLNSRPRTNFTIQFFRQLEDPGIAAEGDIFIGQTTVTTSRKGKRSFTFTPLGLASLGLAEGQTVTATATSNLTSDTSEFSAPVTVSEVP